ncbi:filamentous hemagglutinin N-terminal domain-containing protein [Yoonia sp. GPGPB17]|uniref:two-partner secretion domain-containing protein n=1 Tax=Yoonia sp. GPGPB17 TaxID=3026147 RepID=UPI0030C45418
MLSSVLPSYAQDVIVDPSAPGTSFLQSSNGTPQINIATPQSGVSVNNFTTFSVGEDGLILNNATSGGVSVIGQNVTANPNLMVSGPANTIVAEVTGAAPSSLNGTTEVFGQKAAVIIANPNGIVCNGCAFLNSSQTSLTTGRATVTNGTVNVNVTEGIVTVGSDGFAPGENGNIFAREVMLNGPIATTGGVQAGNLMVSGGAQQVTGAQETVIGSDQIVAAPSTTARNTPFAVDASDAANLTAANITILNREAGQGVNLYGALDAQTATAASAGDLFYKDITLSGYGIITGSEVRQYGNVDAAGLSISGDKFTLYDGRVIASGGNIDIIASDYVVIAGEVSGSDIVFDVSNGSLINNGFLIADHDLVVFAGEHITQQRQIAAEYDVNIDPILQQYVDAYYQQLASGGEIGAIAAEMIARAGLTEAIAEYVEQGASSTAQNISLMTDTGDVQNIGGAMAATRDIAILSGNDVINTAIGLQTKLGPEDGCSASDCGYRTDYNSAELLAGGEIWVSAEQDIRNEASTIAAAGDLTLKAGRDVENTLQSNNFVAIEEITESDTLFFVGGHTEWNRTIFAPASLASLYGDVSIEAGRNFASIGSDVSAGGDIKIEVEGGAELSSVVAANHRLQHVATNACAGCHYPDNWTVTKSLSVDSAHTRLTGKNITIHTGADATLLGVHMNALEDLMLLSREGKVVIDNAPIPDGVALDSVMEQQINQLTGYLTDELFYAANSDETLADGIHEYLESRDARFEQALTDQTDSSAANEYWNFVKGNEALLAVEALARAEVGSDISAAARSVGLHDGEFLPGGFVNTDIDPNSVLVSGTGTFGEESLMQALVSEYFPNITNDLVASLDVNGVAVDQNGNPLFVNHDLTLQDDQIAFMRATEASFAGYDPVRMVSALSQVFADGDVSVFSALGTNISDSIIDASGALNVASSGHQTAYSSSLSGGSVQITSIGDFLAGGLNIDSETDLRIGGTGAVEIGTVARTYDSDTGFDNVAGSLADETWTNNHTIISQELSTLVAGGDLTINPDGNILLAGTKIDSGEDTLLATSGKLGLLAPRSVVQYQSGGSNNGTDIWDVQPHVTEVASGGDFTALSGDTILMEGALIEATGSANIAAANDIMLSAAVEEYRYESRSYSRNWFRTKRSRRTVSETTHDGTDIIAGGLLNIESQTGDLILAGTALQSLADDINVSATQGDILAGTFTDTREEYRKTSRSFLFGLMSSSSASHNLYEMLTGTDILADVDLTLVSGGNTELIGAQLSAGRDLSLNVGGDLIVEAAINTAKESYYEQNVGLVLATTATEESHRETAVLTTFNAGGDISFSVGGNTYVTLYNEGGEDSLPLSELYPEELEALAGLVLLDQTLLDEYFYDETKQLSPAFTVVLTTVLTQGFGTYLTAGALPGLNVGNLVTLADGTTKTVYTLTHAGKAVASMAASTTVGIANGTISGEFDMGEILKGAAISAGTQFLTSSINLKAVDQLDDAALAEGYSNAAFGAVDELGTRTLFGGTWGEGMQASLFGGNNLTGAAIMEGAFDATLGAGINSAVTGADFNDAFKTSFVSSVVALGLADTQNEIGDLFSDANGNPINGGEGSLGHVLLHGMAGCAAAEAQGADCAAGAAGGISSALLSGYFERNPYEVDPALSPTDQEAARRAYEADLSELVATAAGFLASSGKAENVSAAAAIGLSATQHNRQMHPDLAKLIGAYAEDFARELGLCDSNGVCSATQVQAARAYLATAAYRRDDFAVRLEVGYGAEVEAGIAFLDGLAAQPDVLAQLGVTHANVVAASEADLHDASVNLEFSNNDLVAALVADMIAVDASYDDRILTANASPTAILTLTTLATNPAFFDTLDVGQTTHLLTELGQNLAPLGSTAIGGGAGGYIEMVELIKRTSAENPQQGQLYMQALLGDQMPEGTTPDDLSYFGAAMMALQSEVFIEAFINDYVGGSRTDFEAFVAAQGVSIQRSTGGAYITDTAPQNGAFRTTDAVSVTGARSIDKAQSYETGVREIYGGASLSDRSFTVIVDGRRVNGIADDVAVINGRTTAVDAKFTDDWATSIRNPNSPNGTQPWAVAEQQKMINQARNYSEAFDGGAIYHTNNPALAQHYTRVFNDAGISNFEFVVTPTR